MTADPKPELDALCDNLIARRDEIDRQLGSRIDLLPERARIDGMLSAAESGILGAPYVPARSTGPASLFGLTKTKPDEIRLELTYKLSLWGLLVTMVAFGAALYAFHGDSNVLFAAMGPVTSLVGTVVGFVAGHSAGAAGKESADKRAAEAERRLRARS